MPSVKTCNKIPKGFGYQDLRNPRSGILDPIFPGDPRDFESCPGKIATGSSEDWFLGQKVALGSCGLWMIGGEVDCDRVWTPHERHGLGLNTAGPSRELRGPTAPPEAAHMLVPK